MDWEERGRAIGMERLNPSIYLLLPAEVHSLCEVSFGREVAANTSTQRPSPSGGPSGARRAAASTVYLRTRGICMQTLIRRCY